MIPLPVKDPSALSDLASALGATRIGLEIDEVDGSALLRIAQDGLWPQAVPPHQIVTTEMQKRQRAAAIVSQFMKNVKGLKCLDFGCGEGHITRRMRQESANAIGYDPAAVKTGELTNDWRDVKRKGPFDKILVYDVIDHIPRPHWESNLSRLKEVMKPKCLMYVRMHPFCSIHGAHLYSTVNLAYAHLCFSDKQINSLGGKRENVAPVYRPLMTYDDLFDSCALKVVSKNVIKIEAPDFFHSKELTNYLLPRFRKRGVETAAEMHEIMEVAFVDYVLTRR